MSVLLVLRCVGLSVGSIGSPVCGVKCLFPPLGSPVGSLRGTTVRPALPVTPAASAAAAADATSRCTGGTAASEEVRAPVHVDVQGVDFIQGMNNNSEI